ncbi:hypothetical protein [Mesorhizobium sp. dw_380]|uniref:hypothetical protein n=1 Tax=Mesorhizobium sp. dw_380 TaxID=2812001 RepID=UPI001BDE1A4C|nr:hypothetical protein [Mesorhizobium sp. dw_380]
MDDVEPDIHGGSMAKRSSEIKLMAPPISGAQGLIGCSDAGSVPDRMLMLAKRLQTALNDKTRNERRSHPKLRTKRG